MSDHIRICVMFVSQNQTRMVDFVRTLDSVGTYESATANWSHALLQIIEKKLTLSSLIFFKASRWRRHRFRP